jgi:hypothetical protein
MKYLLCIGAMKAGTTTLFRSLQQLEGVNFGNQKEPGHFLPNNVDSTLLDRIDSYYGPSSTVYRADFSTFYSMASKYQNVPKAVCKYCGDQVKIIYVLRDRWSRLHSHYRHLEISYNMQLEFDEAITQFPELVENSLYYKQICEWLKYYQFENILLINFEDLKLKPELEYDKIFQFLDLEKPTDFEPAKRANASIDKPIPRGLFYQLSLTGAYRNFVRPHLSENVKGLALKYLLKNGRSKISRNAVIGEEVKAKIDNCFEQDQLKLLSLIGGS